MNKNKQICLPITRTLALLLFLSVCIFGRALNLPVEGIKPSGTLPILYVNTVNKTPIDQKETYIDAEWYIVDAEWGIGSESEPHKAGIRGRGNTSWRHDGQKPYKLKTEKKESLLGMEKNKHWALLTRTDNTELYNEHVGFEFGRRIGIDFVPEQKPIDLVVNGTYLGMYILSETVRVDKNRVDIVEQPENSTDPDIIPKGWLVELDNNIDPYQVRVPLPDGRMLNVTHKSPEVTSPEQDSWLTNEFEAIIAAVCNPNKLDREWEKYFDLKSVAKFLIVQEFAHNLDAFQGSCYLNKNEDEKWHFGPLWDFSWSLSGSQEKLIVETPDQKMIADIYKFPRFKKVLKEEYDKFMSTHGIGWVRKHMEDYRTAISASAVKSGLVWPYQNLDADKGFESVYDSFLHYSSYLDQRYTNELTVSTLKTELKFFVLENGKKVEYKGERPSYDVLYNGMDLGSAEVGVDTEVEVSFILPEDCVIEKVTNGKSDITSSLEENKIKFNGLKSDTVLSVECLIGASSVDNIIGDSDRPTINVNGSAIEILNSPENTVWTIINASGLCIYKGTSKTITIDVPGFYILTNGTSTHKVIIK